MGKVILKKTNGEITEYTREKQVSNKAWLTPKDNCFLDVLKLTGDYKKEELDSAKSCIGTMVYDILKFPGGEEVIARFYNIIKNAKTQEDLMGLLDLINKAYDHILEHRSKTKYIKYDIERDDIRNRTKYHNLIKLRPELILSIMVKRIVSKYYLTKIMSLNKKEIGRLEYAKLKSASSDELLESIGETFSETSVSNGVKNLSERIFMDVIDVVFDQVQEHLCWENCANATVSKCKKISEGVRKTIDKYDFITDGHQIFGKNGECEHYIVTGCKNYVKEEERVLTLQESMKLSEKKASLMTLYYDAATIEEASAIQSYENRKRMNYLIKRPYARTIK